jgi:hypothetical protein
MPRGCNSPFMIDERQLLREGTLGYSTEVLRRVGRVSDRRAQRTKAGPRCGCSRRVTDRFAKVGSGSAHRLIGVVIECEWLPQEGAGKWTATRAVVAANCEQVLRWKTTSVEPEASNNT